MFGPPTKFTLEFSGIDRVSAIVPGSIPHPFEIVSIAPHRNENRAQDIDVVLLAIGANKVRFTQTALG